MNVRDHPVVRRTLEEAEDDISCADGIMLLADIARVARVSLAEARRAVKREMREANAEDGFISNVRASVAFPTDLRPSDLTIDEAAAIIGERLDIGVFRIRRLAAERAKAFQPPKREKAVGTAQKHPWKVGTRGRSVRTIDHGHQLATLTCGCGTSHDVQFRELAAPDQIDRKFIQAGWRVDPALCPPCIKEKEKSVASAPSQKAVKMQIKAFGLLQQHFDPEKGMFADGWDDDRIARETELAREVVVSYREELFGKLKMPTEFDAIVQDLASLRQLASDMQQQLDAIKTEIGTVQSRFNDARRKFAA